MEGVYEGEQLVYMEETTHHRTLRFCKRHLPQTNIEAHASASTKLCKGHL